MPTTGTTMNITKRNKIAYRLDRAASRPYPRASDIGTTRSGYQIAVPTRLNVT